MSVSEGGERRTGRRAAADTELKTKTQHVNVGDLKCCSSYLRHLKTMFHGSDICLSLLGAGRRICRSWPRDFTSK